MTEEMPEMTEFESLTMQVLSAQYIQLVRIYDFLTVMADKMGLDAIKLKEMHENGETFCPPPYLKEEE